MMTVSEGERVSADHNGRDERERPRTLIDKGESLGVLLQRLVALGQVHLVLEVVGLSFSDCCKRGRKIVSRGSGTRAAFDDLPASKHSLAASASPVSRWHNPILAHTEAPLVCESGEEIED